MNQSWPKAVRVRRIPTIRSGFRSWSNAAIPPVYSPEGYSDLG
ncbi:hypothetical protein [Larkinella harenae]